MSVLVAANNADNKQLHTDLQATNISILFRDVREQYLVAAVLFPQAYTCQRRQTSGKESSLSFCIPPFNEFEHNATEFVVWQSLL